MQPRTLPSLKARLAASNTLENRVQPFVSLRDYSAGGLIHETSYCYDSALRFGPVKQTVAADCPAIWLSSRIRDALTEAHGTGSGSRPIHVSAPTTSLAHRNTISACVGTISECHSCTQEICLIFEDAALAMTPRDTIDALRCLRGQGFRIGVNAQRSWLSLNVPALLLMIDSVWVSVAYLNTEKTLQSHLLQLRHAGVQTVGFDASWSSENDYRTRGLTHIFNGRTDA